MTAQTPYAETEALIAVMEGDEDAAVAFLAGMSWTEREALQAHASVLEALAWRWCDRCEQPIRNGEREIRRGLLGGSRRLLHERCS